MGIYEVSLATVVGIHVILALGLNMISGFCGQITWMPTTVARLTS